MFKRHNTATDTNNKGNDRPMIQKQDFCKDCKNCIYLYTCPYTHILHSYCPHKIKGDPMLETEKIIYKKEMQQAKNIIQKINKSEKYKEYLKDYEINNLVENIFDQTKQILQYKNYNSN